ncbi:YajD family HNH nuclease [Shewanella algidipiscicola]|uniref:Putative HNH nuclease YajD n=1 Tax=Shewanella algidipiscicola TaxID=614070 RepID=A0ABQ4NSA7_9GAMM|nr:YajD family HNH nuclease [Shewanella algidipiscicola]GIU01953.1 HNH endonuclease [Shewanella algidipiscicola]
MSTHQGQSKLDKVLAEAREYKAKRETGYREQALKLYPWVCGRCTREFTHSNLRELTVHHRDHNHDNNPSDGSNWELLCLYCHDNEHAKYEELIQYGATTETKVEAATYNPFADLKGMMSKK